MSVSDNLELFKGIASELQVNEAFIEKDQYAMGLIADLAEISNPKIQLVFAGGTSLSKAHGLIERFSEDLDFKVSLTEDATRRERRDFRKQVIETINKSEWVNVDPDSVKSRNSSSFFQLQVSYPQVFPIPKELRNHIKLEVTFEEPTLPPENRPLTSFVAQAKREDPEVQSIPCVSPVETAADKLSALTWRVLDRDRTQPNDDASLVRHLHDLAALTKTVQASSKFEELALNSMEKDINRGKTTSSETLSPIERMESMLQTLKSDPLYKAEFSKFVNYLSYATDDARPTFETSLNALEGLVKGVKERYLSQQAIFAKPPQVKINPQHEKAQQFASQALEEIGSEQDQSQSVQDLEEKPELEDWPIYASAIGRGHVIQARAKRVLAAYQEGKPLESRDRISLKNTFTKFKEGLAAIQDWSNTAQQLGKEPNYLQEIANTEKAFRQGQPLSDDKKLSMKWDKNQLAYNQLSSELNQDDPRVFLVRLAANAAKVEIRPPQIKEILSLSPLMQAIQKEKGKQVGQNFTRDVIRDGLDLKKQEQPKQSPPGQQRDRDIDLGPGL